MKKCCEKGRIETVYDFLDMGVDSKTVMIVCDLHGNEYINYEEEIDLETMTSDDLRKLFNT